MTTEFFIATLALGYLLAGCVKVNWDFSEDTVNPFIYTLNPKPLTTFCVTLFWVFVGGGSIAYKIILWCIASSMAGAVLWLLSFIIHDIHVRALIGLGLLIPGFYLNLTRK